ncbi:hypothetical protein HYS93_00200 [Candidatus Daviesbacteria bacterium]|nr:hypothetical protein [Candidatus Daviesbacteria bacterium]
MPERNGVYESGLLLIPIYIDPNSARYDADVSKFQGFLNRAKAASDLRIAIVDDGSALKPDQFNGVVDHMISLSVNVGKAQAIRSGLAALLIDPSARPGFIVQYDGDGDQAPEDTASIYNRLIEVSEGNPAKPVLVIGDRYSEGLKTAPNPESVAYRQTLLIFFGSIARNLGFEGVRDWVSGARGYTASYAEGFLSLSRSRRYGVESEQLIIASLNGAGVTTAQLSDSRPRDPWTLTSKWLQNFEIYDAHREGLKAIGRNNVVAMVDELENKLRRGEDEFDLDLRALGEETTISFRRWNERAHTAHIPSDYRARVFDQNAQFPFTLRRVATAGS